MSSKSKKEWDPDPNAREKKTLSFYQKEKRGGDPQGGFSAELGRKGGGALPLVEKKKGPPHLTVIYDKVAIPLKIERKEGKERH